MSRCTCDDEARPHTCLLCGSPSVLQNEGEASEADTSTCTVVRPEGIGNTVLFMA